MFAIIQEIDPSIPESDDEEISDGDDLDLHQRSLRNQSHSPQNNLRDQLSFEAEIARYKVRLSQRDREVADLKAEKEELGEAYLRMQEGYQAVKKQSAEHEDQLKKFASTHSDIEHKSLKDLEAKIAQHEDTIARYESQLSDHQSNEAELRRRLDKLSSVAESYQKIQDDFQIQKHELEQQTKRANAGDKYKQKVQANQAIERERDSLYRQLEDARPKLKAYDETRRDNARLEKENHEIGSTLSRSERDNNELRETKQTVLIENSRLHRDSKSLREALAQCQDKLADYDERFGGSDIHSSPTIVDGGLESELVETSKQEEQMQVANTLLWWIHGLTVSRKLRIAELEKQNSQLTSDASEKDMKMTMLQRQLDNVHDLLADQSAKELRLRQELSDYQSSIAKAREGHPIEGSVSHIYETLNLADEGRSTEIVKRLREQLKAEQKRSTDVEEKLSLARHDVETANNERTSSFERHEELSRSYIDNLEAEILAKPKFDVIEEEKKQISRALIRLQGEYDALKSEYKHHQQRYDAVHEETQADPASTATCQSHQNLTDLTAQLSKDAMEAIKNGNVFSEQNLDKLAAGIEESRNRFSAAQKVDKQLFPSNGTSKTSVFPAFPKPYSTKLPRYFMWKDADILEIRKSTTKIGIFGS